MALTENQAGYFRIGNITLQIPPSDITTSKSTDDQELIPLRAKYAMHQKTGHSRWDVTVHWRALASEEDYSQWEDVRSVLSIFKAAPFVEVENGHLRQILMTDPNSGTDPTARMAFALRMMKVDTIPDIPMGLDITLTMNWFNYLPFSTDFGYAGSSSTQSVDAYQSNDFLTYIGTWKNENLDQAPNPFGGRADLAQKYGYPWIQDWQEQTPGTMQFAWRTYMALQRTAGGIQPTIPSLAGSPSSSTPAPTAPNPTPPSGSAPTVPPGPYQGYQDSVLTAMATQIRRFEGWVVGQIVNGTRQGGTVSWRCCNPGNITPTSAQRTANIPLFANKFIIFPTDSDGWNALKNLIAYYIRHWPQYSIRQFFDRYAPSNDNNDPEKYARVVAAGLTKALGWNITAQTTLSNLWSHNTSSAADSSSFKPAPSTPATPNAQPSYPKSPSQAPPASSDTTQPDPDVQALITPFQAAGWALDHYTERMIFLFQENSFQLADEEHGDGPNDLGLYPLQLSILFVNNLAALPLAGHQYPTYQHVGPAGTTIVVGLASNGYLNGDQEPQHPGLQIMSGMCSALESQYQRLRGEFRSVCAIHRMQAVLVNNQVLNMLGVRGALVRNLTTDTVPETATEVQVALNLVQYENVFEEISPFQVSGTGQAYQQILQTYTKDPAGINKLTNGAQNSVYAPIQQYQQDRNSTPPNPAPILKMLNDTAYISKIKPLPLPINLSSGQMLMLQGLLNGGKSSPSYTSAGGILVASASQTWGQQHPDIAQPVLAGNVNYNNYYRIVNDPVLSKDPIAAALRTSVESSISQAIAAGNETPVQVLYDQVLDYEATHNIQMKQAIQELERDPVVQKQIADATQTSPGLDQNNAGHGAYNDLGLKTLQIGGRDFNPGYYFVDHGQEKKNAIQAEKQTAIQVTVGCTNTFSKKTGSPEVDVDPGATLSALLDNVSIPFLSMSRAFPTFKLFLVEEDNTGPFFMFDNFYSYGTVLNIEVIRYQDKPDTAVITITNFSNLLSHKLFDSSAAGRMEYALENTQSMPVSSDGTPVGAAGANVQMKVNASRTWMGSSANKIINLTEGFNQTVQTPLQYYPLQTGGKIQVRMGFSNNPDMLFPIFNGKITQIEGEEVLQVVCQGFMLELMDPAPEELRHDGFFNLSTVSGLSGILSSVKDVFSGEYSSLSAKISAIENDFMGAFGGGAAYGGWTLLREKGETGGGDTGSVMDAMLKTANAKHFGYWQINPAAGSSQYVKGFGWTDVVGQIAGSIGATTIYNLLSSGRDRRAENILINQIVNSDGTTSTEHLQRSWNFERPLNYFPAAYHVPNDPTLTPWHIIRDVARRYSEYILAVRPYGFPVGADATLLFAYPNDFYITAPPVGSSAQQIATFNSTDNASFQIWWGGQGRAKFLSFATTPAGGVFRTTSQWVLTQVQPTFGNRFANAINSFGSVYSPILFGIDDMFHPTDSTSANALAKYIDGQGGKGDIARFNDIMKKYLYVAQQAGFVHKLSLGDGAAQAQRVIAAIQSLQNQLAVYLQWAQQGSTGKVTDPRPSDRVQPVRRWHFINEDVIIHNGIRLNDQIFNATRVNRDILKANQNIPNHYTRILDCDHLIVAPELNASSGDLRRAYQQSFLREEMGKMYRGELVLTSIPEIQPYDVLLLYDPATGMAGPVEVDSVIHSFSPETGAITIVTPRALMILNDSVTAGMLVALGAFFQTLPGEVRGLAQDIKANPKAGALLAADTALSVGEGYLAKYALGTAAAAVGIGLTVGLPITLSVLGAAIAIKLVWMADDRQRMYPIFMAPLNRFGRPWVGGLQGWQLSDMHTYLLGPNGKFMQFWDFEIAPTIQAFKTLNQISQSSWPNSNQSVS